MVDYWGNTSGLSNNIESGISKKIFFEASKHEISTSKQELYLNSLKQLFYSYTYEKTFSSSFNQKVLFGKIVAIKVVGSMPKYSLLTEDKQRFSFFCYIYKNEQTIRIYV